MSKKMTPCEKLGYKVGDKFSVIKGSYFEKGAIVVLSEDDGSKFPWFSCGNKSGALIVGSNADVEPFAKLKPAKQALADAIHQNGGWAVGNYAVYGKHSGKCSFLTCKPKFQPKDRGWFVMLSWIVGEFEMKPFVNWHQTILSRDEYFTAYPEQVKVEVNNETGHKVEAEMKSESEVTINIGDWHKNGELPPVGVFVDVVGRDLVYGQGESNCEVIAHVENTAVIRMSYGLGCFESGAITPARTEREKAIDEMAKVVGLSVSVFEVEAGKLYDAGYRKGVK